MVDASAGVSGEQGCCKVAVKNTKLLLNVNRFKTGRHCGGGQGPRKVPQRTSGVVVAGRGRETQRSCEP